MADGDGDNSKALMIGELRGEFSALLRAIEAIHADQRHQISACADCQRAVTMQMRDLTTKMSNHIVFHTTTEKAAAQTAVGEQVNIAETRWSGQMKVMLAGILLSFAGSVAGVIHNWK